MRFRRRSKAARGLRWTQREGTQEGRIHGSKEEEGRSAQRRSQGAHHLEVAHEGRDQEVGSEFYSALDKHVRDVIAAAEKRALGNKRKTLKAVDL